jgi:PII-like signaling protein
MLTGEVGPVALPEELHEATKVTIYVGRQERVSSTPAFVAVCDLLHRRGIAGATALLGVDGTCASGRASLGAMRRCRAGEQIARVLPELGGMLRRPLVTLERVCVCKCDGQLLSAPTPLPATDEQGLAMWQKLMVYASDQARHGRSPLHVALAAGSARAAGPAYEECGASTATTRRTAIVCSSFAAMFRL